MSVCLAVALTASAYAAPDLTTWQAQAQATSGNVVNDTGLGDGVAGGAGYVFDGTASIAYDYGQLNVSNTAHDDGSTIEAIFNLTDPGQYDHMIDQTGWGIDRIRLNHETWSATNGIGIGISYPGAIDYSWGVSVNDTDVHVIWRENGDGTVNLFVDGVDLGASSYSNFWLNGGVGTLGGLAGEGFVTGTVYGIATYDRALTAAEIDALIGLEPPPPPDSTTWQEAVSNKNPLNWYKFEETSGTTCIDHGSEGLNGTYQGVSLAQQGAFGPGSAVSFNGSGVNNVLLNGSEITSDWTAEFVIMKTWGGYQALFEGGSYSLRLDQYGVTGQVGFTQYGVADYTFTPQPGQSVVLPENIWLHLVFRKNSSGTQVFINGLLAGTSGNSIPLPRISISDGLLNAVVDEVVVYNRSLSDSEIQQNYSLFLPEDTNRDGMILLDDLAIVVQQWLEDCDPSDWCGAADIDKSGKVDLEDIARLSQEWLYNAPPAPSETEIIPRPVTAEATGGSFNLQSNTQILIEQAHSGVAEAGQLLTEILNTPTGFSYSTSTTTAPTPSANQILLTTVGSDPALGDEGYELIVDNDSVLIRAPHTGGLIYGVQSLRQLLPHEIERDSLVTGVTWAAECVNIWDKPRFGWRGMMLDASRHFQSVEFVKDFIDSMSLYKLNTFHWHLVDGHGWRIAINQYPLLTSIGAWRNQPGYDDGNGGNIYGGYYTQAQIAEVVEYARRRNITVVPEIEMPGHSAAAIAAYNNLTCSTCTSGYGVDYFNDYPMVSHWFPPGYCNELCPGKDSTFTFLEDVLTEVMALFPSQYIHIGGDEASKAFWPSCPDCQARMASEGISNVEGLQSYLVGRIETFLNGNGRSLIGWDEILQGGLSPNATVMSWQGTSGGVAAAQAGHDAVMSPQQHIYFDHYQSNSSSHPPAWPGVSTLENVYAYEPVPGELSPAEIPHILGAQANMWTVYTYTDDLIELMCYPRALALSEITWSPKDVKNLDDFLLRLNTAGLNRLSEMEINYYSE
jgi:N-acetyl-beta-hexosaminidase